MNSALRAVLPNMIIELEKIINAIEILGMKIDVQKVKDTLNDLPQDDIEKVRILEPLIVELRHEYDNFIL